MACICFQLQPGSISLVRGARAWAARLMYYWCILTQSEQQLRMDNDYWKMLPGVRSARIQAAKDLLGGDQPAVILGQQGSGRHYWSLPLDPCLQKVLAMGPESVYPRGILSLAASLVQVAVWD